MVRVEWFIPATSTPTVARRSHDGRTGTIRSCSWACSGRSASSGTARSSTCRGASSVGCSPRSPRSIPARSPSTPCSTRSGARRLRSAPARRCRRTCCACARCSAPRPSSRRPTATGSVRTSASTQSSSSTPVTSRRGAASRSPTSPTGRIVEGRRARLVELHRRAEDTAIESLLDAAAPPTPSSSSSSWSRRSRAHEVRWTLLVRALVAAERRPEHCGRTNGPAGTLAAELGITPGAELDAAHRAALADDMLEISAAPSAPDDPIVTVERLLASGAAMWQAGDARAATATFVEAAGIARQRGDVRRFAEAVLAPPATGARLPRLHGGGDLARPRSARSVPPGPDPDPFAPARPDGGAAEPARRRPATTSYRPAPRWPSPGHSTNRSSSPARWPRSRRRSSTVPTRRAAIGRRAAALAAPPNRAVAALVLPLDARERSSSVTSPAPSPCSLRSSRRATPSTTSSVATPPRTAGCWRRRSPAIGTASGRLPPARRTASAALLDERHGGHRRDAG